MEPIFFLLAYCLLIMVSSKRLKAKGYLYIAPLIPALVAVGQAGYQIYQSEKQKKQAKKLKPSNYIPPSVKEAVATARMGANSTVMPGYGRFIDKLRASSANTISRVSKSTTNPNQVQQAVSDTDAREKETLKDLEVSNEEFRVGNRNNLINLLGVQGGFEKSSMDAFNQTKSALTGASMQNKYNAITTLGENLIAGMGNKTGVGNQASVVGKTGEDLTKTLDTVQKSGRALTAEELDYISKLGLKPDTLKLSFPSLKFN